jgi:DNA-binding transcriptional LysR family regulator
LDRLDAMETFVRVIDAGSFSAAARHLKIGQSAVSKAIAQLEERLGVRLLLRSPRGLQPTEAGQRFYERAARMVQEAADAEAEARGAASGLAGKLRVSASICFARIHILPKLPGFLANHPRLELEVVLDDRMIDLVKEGIDVALRTGPIREATLTFRQIAQARRLVMASASYFEAHGIPTTPGDLATHQTIRREQRATDSHVTFCQGSKETTVEVSGQLRVASTEALREAVLANLGIAIISEWLFTPELASGNVRAVLEDWSLPPHILSAVYASGRRPSAKARAFVSFVEACMKEEATATKVADRLNVVRAS